MFDSQNTDEKLAKEFPVKLDAMPNEDAIAVVETSTQINASGHRDQLDRQYGLVGLTGIAVTVNNAWVVLGSSISVSLCKTS